MRIFCQSSESGAEYQGVIKLNSNLTRPVKVNTICHFKRHEKHLGITITGYKELPTGVLFRTNIQPVVPKITDWFRN